MSGPEGAELKKRRVDMSTTNGHSTKGAKESKTKSKGARTVSLREVPEWQRDNRYILSGYRPEKADYKAILVSLTFAHNETCNVYTHLIGAFLLPLVAAATMRYLDEPRFVDVMSMDYFVFGVFFLSAEICLILSTLFHLMGCHSHAAEQFWHGLDMLGIIICIVGTFFSGINFIFLCEGGLQYVHWGIVSFFLSRQLVVGSDPVIC